MTFSGPIGELIEFAIGGGWGSELPKEKYSRVSVIRGTDIPRIVAGEFSSVPIRYESDRKLVSRLLVPGDLVLETAGGSSANGQFTGRTLLITEEILRALGPTICASFCKRLVLKKELVSPKYFYFYMQDLYNSGRVAAYDSQSTGISNFQYEAFINNEILQLPKLSEQTSIAEALSNIQVKIVTNSRISNTLESIARTLFKSWFIDFDPVKEKIAGKKPVGMHCETAALFPDSLEESELGLIPWGWEWRRINTLTSCVVGGTPSRLKEEYWNGDIPWVNSGKINEFRITEPSEYITNAGLKKSAAKLMPVGTTLLAMTGATLGQFSRLEIEAAGTQNVIGVLSSDAVSSEFIYESIAFGMPRIVAAGTGGAQQHINKAVAEDFQLLYPGLPLMRNFTELVKPLFDSIAVLEFQSNKLKILRDSLLPRLISGELQVSEEDVAS